MRPRTPGALSVGQLATTRLIVNATPLPFARKGWRSKSRPRSASRIGTQFGRFIAFAVSGSRFGLLTHEGTRPAHRVSISESVEQVQQITDDWLVEYNEERPLDSLGRVPPLTYMAREITAGESGFRLST